MKVTGYQVHPVRVVQEHAMPGTHVVLRLRTDEGIEGVSYVSRLNDQTLRPFVLLLELTAATLIGKDPLVTEERYRELYREDNAVAGPPVGLEARAASAIDAALWDIKGKAADQPVFRLMGATRNRIPVSANWAADAGVDRETLARNMERHLEAGFRAMKFRAGHLTRAAFADHMRTLRELAGPEVRLMADGNFRWTAKEAVAMCDAVEPYDLHWIEDPVPAHDLEALRQVTDSVPMAVCAGEAFQTLHQHRAMFEQRCSDFAMADMDLGLTGFQRVAGLAALYRVPLINHLACEILVHGMLAAPTGHIAGFNAWAQPLFTEPVTIEDGDLVLSERPGLGLELDEDALTRFAID